MRIAIYSIITLVILFTANIYASSVFPINNRAALKGVKEFDYQTIIGRYDDFNTDDEYKLPNREIFETTLKDKILLGLRRDGVTVTITAPNYLMCVVSVSLANSRVIYTIEINYYEYNSEENDVHKLLWTTGSLYTVGLSNFTAEGVANACVDDFSSAWLAENPK